MEEAGKTSDNRYRNLGIWWLIVIVLSSLLPFLEILFLLATGNLSSVTQLVASQGQYFTILFYLFGFLNIVLTLWGLWLSLILIRYNRYDKHLPLWVYCYVAINVLSFVLHLPFGWGFVDLNSLIIAILVYVVCIHNDNYISRLVKGKTAAPAKKAGP